MAITYRGEKFAGYNIPKRTALVRLTMNSYRFPVLTLVGTMIVDFKNPKAYSIGLEAKL